MYLIFDTETTGLPKRWDAPITDTANWPRCIQIAWQLHDDMGKLIEHQDYLVRPEGFNIPYDAERIHGISTELAEADGISLSEVLLKLPGGRGGKFKLPTLTELHSYLFNKPFGEAHNATADVEATTRCFLELIRTEVF